MNENLNLVEILKDCPSGTKLYSTVFGEVIFDNVAIGTAHPIVIRLKDGSRKSFSAEGKLYIMYDGECTLFPSKNQRDWSKFNPKKEGFITPREFKDGDIVATNSGLQVFILQRQKSDKEGYFYIGYDFGLNDIFHAGECKFNRLATEEEKQKLFEAIKKSGYKWNSETNTLEKFVEPKFDPKTLKPFDKVLVYDIYDICEGWACALFSHIRESEYPYSTSSGSFKVCIPYNEDTKHLLGTSDEAPEYYRYWEK